MSFSWRVRGVLVVGLALAAGCGGSVTNGGGNSGGSDSSGGSGSGGAPGHPAGGELSAASFPVQLAQLACDTLEPCCAAGQLTFDRAACLRGLSDGPVNTGDGVAFDSAAAQRCLDEFDSATQGCSAFDKSQLPDCSRLTQGTLPLGAACTSDRQCASNAGRFSSCEYAPNSTTGSCTLVPEATHALPGGACDATCFADGNCEVGSAPTAPAAGANPPQASGNCYLADGLYCAWDLQQCWPIGRSGDTCRAHEGCSSGLVCIGLVDQYTSNHGAAHPGSCGPAQPEGSPCVNSAECATLACDTTTGFCVHVPLATAGLCVGLIPGAD